MRRRLRQWRWLAHREGVTVQRAQSELDPFDGVLLPRTHSQAGERWRAIRGRRETLRRGCLPGTGRLRAGWRRSDPSG